MSYNASASISINAPVDRVWDALTKPELVKKYFFNTDLVTDWRVGSPIYFRGEWEGKSYEDKGTVLAFEAPKMLSYSYWSSMGGKEDKPENYQILRYEVAPEGEGSKVTISQENAENQEAADHSSNNWQSVLTGLKDILEKA